MKRKILFALWVWALLLCACFGHITQPTPAQAGALTVVGILSFLPGVFLLADGLRTGSGKLLWTIRGIALGSLTLTLIVFLLNMGSVTASEKAGDFLNELLLWISAPMYCITPRFLSLFLWACLLFASFVLKKPSR